MCSVFFFFFVLFFFSNAVLKRKVKGKRRRYRNGKSIQKNGLIRTFPEQLW